MIKSVKLHTHVFYQLLTKNSAHCMVWRQKVQRWFM